MAPKREPLTPFWEARVNDMLGLDDKPRNRSAAARAPAKPAARQPAQPAAPAKPAQTKPAARQPAKASAAKPAAKPAAARAPASQSDSVLSSGLRREIRNERSAAGNTSAASQRKPPANASQPYDIFGEKRAPPTHQRPVAGVNPGCTLAQQRIAAANNGRRMDQKEHQVSRSAGVDLTKFELNADGSTRARPESKDEQAMNQVAVAIVLP